MKGWSTLAGNVTIRQLQRGILPDIKGQFMKGWSILVLCAATKHPGGVLTNTKEQFMKRWSTLAGNVTIRQLQRGILPNTKGRFMKGWSILAGIVTIRQLQRGILPDTKEQFMKGWSTLVLCASTKHPRKPLLTITGKRLTLNSNFLFAKCTKLLRNVSKCLVLIFAWQSFHWHKQ